MKSHNADDDIDGFLLEALRIQAEQKDEPLSEERLKVIALRCGFSGEEWDRLCDDLNSRVTRGRQFLEFENAEDAVVELEKAAALAPYRADVLADRGRAHALLWKQKKVKPSRQRGLDLFTRALDIDAGNEAAARGLSELKKEKTSRPSILPRRIAILSAAAAVVVAAGLWFRLSPTAESPLLPETAMKELPVSGTGSVGDNLPEGAVVFGDRAFLIVQEDIPWHEARKRCEEMGGHLAMIKDSETHEFIKARKRMKRLWLGATDEHLEGDWRWIDGTPMDFDGWAGNQPFNMMGREHYMEIGPGGGFNDVSVEGPTEKFRIDGFICEWDLTPGTKLQSVEMSLGAVPTNRIP